ncbi:PAS domain S-box protein [Azonexus sp. IMCC34842]|uniref:PAS domain S-box protein n=1 Tax=Azonexus sp. IMCC34842 TaxID=3420950 RepID=UPI003D0EBF84
MPDELTPNPQQNRILAALTPNDYARLQDDLELVSLKLGQTLFASGDSTGHVYFPTSAIVSLMLTTSKGASSELAVTGNDGFVGTPLVLGGYSTTHSAICRCSGSAYRLKIEVMRWELDQGGDLQHLALRYTQALMTQMAQSVVCNRHHTVVQRLCRWLLLCLDRMPGNQLNMTQELIAGMLGVRREAVTDAAGKLQSAGAIQYCRGLIEIIDRAGLEALACECYAAVKSEYDRLFQLPTTQQHFTSRLRSNPETLRKRAEARLLQALPEDSKTAWDNAQLVHELRVNQIELEMHNEELRHAYDEADALLERYADIYDFAPLSYFTLNRDGIIADLNLAGSILLGVKGSQKGRYRFDTHVTPADLPAFNLFFERVFAAKDKTVGEFVLSANIYRPEASVKIEAVPDENGEECRMVVIDISAAKHAEKALRVREQYLRAVVDNFPFMVWLKDPGGRFLAVNSALASSFGWPSANTLIGKTDFDIASQELAERSLAGDLAVLQSGERKTLIDLIEMDGEQRWFEVYKSPVSLEGEAIGTVGFARDITERYKTQQALKNSEKQYRRLIEKMPLSIAILQDGILKYINPKGIELLGYPADECQGKSFLPLVYEADREWAGTAHQTHSLGGQTAPGSEIRLLGKTGQVIDCLMHVNSVEWEGRIAALAIFEDVTAKKQIEAELRRMASIDPLTELATRPHFLIHMEQAQSRLMRGIDREAAALLLELDDFQTIHDALGHLAGDATLRLFSALLRDELRRVDFAARVDHERFAVLLPESDAAAARVFAERLREKVAGMAIIIDDRQVSITVSIGIAALDIADQSPDDAFLRAEKALTRARRAGGDRTALARRAGQRAN